MRAGRYKLGKFLTLLLAPLFVPVVLFLWLCTFLPSWFWERDDDEH